MSVLVTIDTDDDFVCEIGGRTIHSFERLQFSSLEEMRNAVNGLRITWVKPFKIIHDGKIVKERKTTDVGHFANFLSAIKDAAASISDDVPTYEWGGNQSFRIEYTNNLENRAGADDGSTVDGNGIMETFYHATRHWPFAVFDTALDTTGLGIFLTADADEAFERFADTEEHVVIEVSAPFANPVGLEDLLDEAFRARAISLSKRDATRIAAQSGYGIADAICRRDYGKSVNSELSAFARRKGYDGIFHDDWAIALDPALLRMTRVMGLDGENLPIDAPAP